MFVENQSFFRNITKDTTLFWFRRDLRLSDNAGLYHALKNNQHVIPVFIFDTVILNELDDKKDRRVEFILESLRVMNDALHELGSSLLIVHDDPVNFFARVTPKAVFTNHDYEPYARQRDEKIRSILETKGTVFKTFKDQVIFEKG